MAEYEVGINFTGNFSRAAGGIQNLTLLTEALGFEVLKTNKLLTRQNELFMALGIAGAVVMDKLLRGADRYNRMLTTLQNTTLGVAGAHQAMARAMSMQGPYKETSPQANTSLNQQLAGYFPLAQRSGNIGPLNAQSAALRNLILGTNLGSGKQATSLTESVVGNVRAYEAFVKGNTTSGTFLGDNPAQKERRYLQMYAGMSSDAGRAAYAGDYKGLIHSPYNGYLVKPLGFQGALNLSAMATRAGVDSATTEKGLKALGGHISNQDVSSLEAAGFSVGDQQSTLRVAQGFRYQLPMAFRADPVGFLRGPEFSALMHAQTGLPAMTYAQFQGLQKTNPKEYAQIRQQMLGSAKSTMGDLGVFERMMFTTSPAQLAAISNTKLTTSPFINAITQLGASLDKLYAEISTPLIGALTTLINTINSVVGPAVAYFAKHPDAAKKAGYGSLAVAGGAMGLGVLKVGHALARIGRRGKTVAAKSGAADAAGADAGADAAFADSLPGGAVAGEGFVMGGGMSIEGISALMESGPFIAVAATVVAAVLNAMGVPIVKYATKANNAVVGEIRGAGAAFGGFITHDILGHRTAAERVARVKVVSALDDKKYGLPPGTLEGIAKHESGGGIKLVNPHSSARGAFQQLSEYRHAYNVLNWHSISQEANATGAFLRKYSKIYGHLGMAVAAYGMGPGAFDAAMKKPGADWFLKIPLSNQQEVLDADPGADTRAAAAAQASLHGGVHHHVSVSLTGVGLGKHIAKKAKIAMQRVSSAGAGGIHTSGALAGSHCA